MTPSRFFLLYGTAAVIAFAHTLRGLYKIRTVRADEVPVWNIEQMQAIPTERFILYTGVLSTVYAIFWPILLGAEVYRWLRPARAVEAIVSALPHVARSVESCCRCGDATIYPSVSFELRALLDVYPLEGLVIEEWDPEALRYRFSFPAVCSRHYCESMNEFLSWCSEMRMGIGFTTRVIAYGHILMCRALGAPSSQRRLLRRSIRR